MRFGERVRKLRKAKHLSQRALGEKVGISFTYVCKIENEKLDFGDYPSEELIGKLAVALEVEENELLLLAEKIPQYIRKRVLQRPDAFGKFATLDDATLDDLLTQLGETPTPRRPTKLKAR